MAVDNDATSEPVATRKPNAKVSAAEKRRLEILARAERRRHEVAVEIDSSQEVLARARAFTRKYDGITVERAESQSFWNDLLHVFGIDRRAVGAEFERVTKRSDTGGTGRIDVLWPGVFLAEHKSAGKDFASALAQADSYELDEEELPRITVVCDFARFYVRDNHTQRFTEFALSEFPQKLGWFGPLVHDELTELSPQRPVDVKAAEKMADLHDELRAAGYSGHNLRVLMTRLLFCFFADDANIWPHGKFDAYLRSAPPQFAGAALAQLFEVLNTAPKERTAMLDDALKTFPYVNGGLFAENLPISNLNVKLLDALLITSEEVDWAAVSPAVFGAMFQGVMDATERHDLGAHYTSEENIFRLIEPLFLDELYQNIEDATTVGALEKVWNKMTTLRFLDPAAGCGNFLVVSYRELRRVERHLMEKIGRIGKDDPKQVQKYPWISGQRFLDSSAASKLHVGQFFGIEIDEWPAQIAQVAMWLTDHLANMELEEQFGGLQTRLPLLDTAHITVGNALRLDWNDVMGDERATHILGNPPFLGRRLRNDEQNEDMAAVWGKTKGSGDLDYVTCWFRRAAEYIDGTDIRVALVSTNSLSQGEQPPVLWGYLTAHDIHIDFAHRSFNWTNEARGKAAVHVVITGFSQGRKSATKQLWYYPDLNKSGVRAEVSGINAYLLPGEMVIVGTRRKPIVPHMPTAVYGSMPIEEGHLVVSEEEATQLATTDPVATKFLRRYVGAREMLYNTPRYCLWLEGAEPSELRKSSFITGRIERVKEFRSGSKRPATQALAATPSLFGERRQPLTTYVAVPKVSSQRREYLPLAVLDPSVVASGSLILVTSDDALLAFGVLSSRVMTQWNAVVSGRMKSDFQFSIEVTYNNFPWPDLQEAQRVEINAGAKAVLEARDAHANSTLADLYDPLTMPPNLVKAHKELDKVVLALYGLKPSATDDEVLATLFDRYRELQARAK